MLFSRKINELETQLRILELKVSDLKTIPNDILMRLERAESHIISLRGYVNKKLNPANESYETPEESKPTKEFNDGCDVFRGL